VYRKDLATGGIVGLGGMSGRGATLSRPENTGNTIFYGQAYSTPGGNASDLYALDMDAGAAVRLLQGAPDVLRCMKEDADYIFYSLESGGLFRTPLLPAAPDGGFIADQLVADPDADFDLLGDMIYVAASGSIFSLPKSADASTHPVLLYLFGEPRGLTADGSDLYWYDGTAQTINRGTLDGFHSTVLASVPASPLAIAVDAVSVYVAVGPSVMAVDKDGTRLRTYATWGDAGAADHDVATSVAFDDGYVYWGRSIAAPSSLWRVAK
jgi:hypothetical protein